MAVEHDSAALCLGTLLDTPISHIRVQRVDGATHDWDVAPQADDTAQTLRSLLLGPWHGITTEDDKYKLLAG